MRTVGGVSLWAFIAVWSGLAAAADKTPPVAAVREVSDTYFGTKVADPYRWMEQPDSAELKQYLQEQNDYTRAVFGTLAEPRAALLKRIKELQRGTAAVRFVERVDDRYFFLETPAGEKAARLMTRAVAGGDKRVLLDPSAFAAASGHASIDFYSVSNDGKTIAVAVSHGGGEDWTFRFVDVASAKLLPDEVVDTAEPFPGWSSDNKAIYYSRLQAHAPGASDAAKLDNIRVYRHVLGTDVAQDDKVFGVGIVPEIPTDKQSFSSAGATREGRYDVANASLGTEQTRAYWIRDAKLPASPWRQIAAFTDKISMLAVHDGRAYAIAQKNSNGQVIAFDVATSRAADAKVLVDTSDVVISAENGDLAAASDALYVAGQRDGASVVIRVPYDGTPPRDLKLPATGDLIEFGADALKPGISFALQSPTLSPRVYRYDPAADASIDTGLYVADPADFSGIVSRKIEFDSTDGARVAMTITMRKDLKLDGTHPTLMTAYGAYGAIVPMWFSAPNLAWYEKGGILAHVHARGGGEKGEAWHQAATKTHKQHTIDDVIAAARFLIDAKYTSADHLAVAGKSAGGIPAGGALVQHPELFGAALIRVGVVDMLRFEQSALGAANTLEFGSVSNEAEFRALNAFSPYANVRNGVAYPAVLLETGINDPRVPSWQLAKMTARLQASTSSKRPILLRVDYDAGHGLGSDKDQIAELMADEFTFLGWRLGLPGFAPH